MSDNEIKELVISSLTNKSNYDDSDELLIKEIPNIIKIIQMSWNEIINNGILVYDNKDQPKENPALRTYKNYSSLLESRFLQLGLTPRERNKLKAQLQVAKNDGFDD